MHQSGQLRLQSMQAVQFSSTREMTPRARSAGASFSAGYCTVTEPFEGWGTGFFMPSGNIVRRNVRPVTLRPVMYPEMAPIRQPP